MYVILAHWEVDILGPRLLEVTRIDEVLALPVEQAEAVSSFFFSASVVPLGDHHVPASLEGYAVGLEDFLLLDDLLQLLVDFLLGAILVSEVVKDASELSHSDGVLLLVFIEVEGILQVSHDVAWQLLLVTLLGGVVSGLDLGVAGLLGLGSVRHVTYRNF